MSSDLPPAGLGSGHPNASGRAPEGGASGFPANSSLPLNPEQPAPSPFLHFEPERIYDPLTDRELRPGDGLHQALLLLQRGEALPDTSLTALREGGWAVASQAEAASLAHASYLKYVSLEAHTVCNQACYFCPVSIAPREAHFMATELYENIVSQLAAYRSTIEAVFMINYNEPTADPRFIDQVRTLRDAGLPPAVLTNGSGLTPKRVDALLALGGLRFLSINLSTLDRQRYEKERGLDQLDLVLRHVDYASTRELATQMDVVVLGTGDAKHQQDFEAISARYAGSRFSVKKFEVMDRAGHLEVGLKPVLSSAPLRGCENVGSRPLQHLHITPHAQCVLCCEDYDEKYVVGDLTTHTVAEVLRGPEFARLRRWVYGLDEAPADFLCRGCIFARRA